MPDPFYAGGGIGLGPRPETVSAAPYPPPVVRSTDGVSGPRKSAVDGLAALARSHGWTVMVTYAVGHYPHATHGTPSAEPRASLAVRMMRGTERAVAVYVEGSGAAWSWQTMLRWTVGRMPARYATIGAFTGAVLGDLHTVTSHGWHPPWVRGWK